jgi:hypothetical protein
VITATGLAGGQTGLYMNQNMTFNGTTLTLNASQNMCNNSITNVCNVGLTYTAPFAPTSVSGCTLWLDGADTSTMTFSSVSNLATWRDKSTSLYTATNFGTPVYAPNVKNTLGVIQFATGGGVTVPSFVLSPQMSVFMVYYPNGQGTNGPPIEQSSNSSIYPGFLVESGISNFLIRTSSIAAPSGLTFTQSGTTMVGAWTAYTGATSYFYTLYSNSIYSYNGTAVSGGTGTVTAPTVTFTYASPTAGTYYYYTLNVTTSAGTSPLSTSGITQYASVVSSALSLTASGGTVSNVTGYSIYEFTTVGPSNFTLTSPAAITAQVMVVGGGGSGGANWGGGGGAGGGFVSNVVLTSASYNTVVGPGGYRWPTANGVWLPSITGCKTIFTSYGTEFAGLGGGAGCAYSGIGSNGACGGGGSGMYTTSLPNSNAGGSGTQGYAGGYGLGSNTYATGAGGGGGMGSIGSNGSALVGGNGGNGVTFTFGTKSYAVCGGGGGGGGQSGATGAGTGTNGGGAGGYQPGAFGTQQSGSDATANTGSGGGGAAPNAGVSGGAGGSGILSVVIPTTQTLAAPTVPTLLISANAAVLSWTAGVMAATYDWALYSSTPNGYYGTVLSNANVGTTTVTVSSGITAGTYYYFTVRSSNASGVSAYTVSPVSVSPASSVLISYLIVAGGGGGGSDANGGGGGGGGGGVLTGSAVLVTGTVYNVVVGGGGSNVTSGYGGSGSNSTALGFTAIGGGGGAWASNTSNTANQGISGGSGGGSSAWGTSPTVVGGSGSAQGYAGGGVYVISGRAGGGGGGGGGVGQSSVSNSVTYNGGPGFTSSITGSAVVYGGGGGGNSDRGVPYNGTGGTGGGGAGGTSINSTTAVAGTPNTGGGGGGYGCASSALASGAGGSGVVIFSIPTASYSGTFTGSPTVTTSGGNTIIKFTGATGSYTA